MGDPSPRHPGVRRRQPLLRDGRTRHLPEKYRRAIQFVTVGGRTRIALRGQITEYIPNAGGGRTAAHQGRRDDVASYKGEHVGFDQVECRPWPVRREIPLTIGGASKAALRRAARSGDGYFLRLDAALSEAQGGPPADVPPGGVG